MVSGAEGFTSKEDHETLVRIEKLLKQRFAIGSQVSQESIMRAFEGQGYPAQAVVKVIQAMLMRGQLQHRMQRRLLYRLS